MSGRAGFRWAMLLRFGPFHWSALAPLRAARAAVGIVVPLIVGWATGHLDYGAYAALGALPAGFASFEGVTRSRIMAVVVATVGMAVSTFVGGTVAWLAPWLFVPVVIVWGGITGLAVCLGRRASIAVLQWPVALLIAAGLPLSPGAAALRAVLVLAGGAFQGLLVVCSWLVRPGARERAALADRFAGLERYASDIAAGARRPPAPIEFAAVENLQDPNPLLSSRTHLIFMDMLEQAERVRASLASLAAQDAPEDAQDIRSFASGVSAVLRLVTDALVLRRGEPAASDDAIEAAVTKLEVPAGSTWHWAGEALGTGPVKRCSGSYAQSR